MELRTEIEIEAPAERVWEVLTDFDTYGDWNPFIASVQGDLTPGAELVIELTPPEGRRMRFRPKVIAVEPGKELRWRGQLFFRWLFEGEHFFQVIALDTQRTRFVHGENFKGALLKLMNKTLTQTARGFVGMNHALRRRVAGLTAER